ncbi:MAG: deoxyribodipyrimidine photo-lyase [Sulfolobaceae archaeon]
MKCIFWFRRDLRIFDNVGLVKASEECEKVFPVVVIDPNIMFRDDTSPRRAQFYLEAVRSLSKKIPLTVFYGNPVKELIKASKKFETNKVYFNRDYGYYSSKRDSEVCNHLECKTFKDHVLVEKGEIPIYKLFTSYYMKWKEVKKDLPLGFPKGNFFGEGNDVPNLFSGYKIPCATEECAMERLKEFKEKRVYDWHNTTKLSPYIKIGLISVRVVYHELNMEEVRRQICWRDFYYQLYTSDFNYLVYGIRRLPINWRESEEDFRAWTEGRTGYPIIDAAMRELSETGWMDNRLRLLTAFFLTKILRIDWKKGALHFMKNLIDGDYIINTANWQWVASIGVDPRPFRKFNIIEQGKKYDPEGTYIRRWVHELKDIPKEYIHEPWKIPSSLQKELKLIIGKDYPYPIIDLEKGYEEFIKLYKSSKLRD